VTRECHARFCERRRAKLPPSTHHLMRERSDWELEQPEAGMLVFTSPEGRQYVTEPEPYVEP